MTLHKLSAGSGYEYLTRQVAALDSTENGATPLADYYAAKGRRRADGSAPGWSALPGVAAGDVVTAEQMKHRRQLVRASGQDRGRGSEAAHSGTCGVRVIGTRPLHPRPQRAMTHNWSICVRTSCWPSRS